MFQDREIKKMGSYTGKVHFDGPDELVVDSGGSIDVDGTLDLSGGVVELPTSAPSSNPTTGPGLYYYSSNGSLRLKLTNGNTVSIATAAVL